MKKLLLIAVAIGLSFPLLAQTNFRFCLASSTCSMT